MPEQQKQPIPWRLIIWGVIVVSALGVVSADLLSSGVLIGEIAKLVTAVKAVGR
jgi:hypothetical protein